MGGQPLLSPQPIVDGLVQLDSMMKKLESTILDIMNDIQQKKQVLAICHMCVLKILKFCNDLFQVMHQMLDNIM